MAAHVRHAVHRHVVLRGPAQLRLDPEALARPRLEPRVALGGVRLAGLVALAAHEQPVAVRPDRVRGLLGGQVHARRAARWCGRPPRTSARGGSGRSRARGRGTAGAWPPPRVPRSPSGRTAVRTRPPCTWVAIVPSCSGPSSAAAMPLQVLHRVELRLVVEAHRARHRERQIERPRRTRPEARARAPPPPRSRTWSRSERPTPCTCSSACGAGRSRCRAPRRARRRARSPPRSPRRTCARASEPRLPASLR